jgi:hypothetical protein
MAAGFRLGVVQYASFPHRDDEEAFWTSLERLLGDPALGAVELNTFLSPGSIARIRRLFERGEKRLLLSAGPQLLGQREGLCAVARKSRAATVELCKGLIDMAQEVSASALMLISGKHPGPGQQDAAWAALEESLEELCEYARAGPSITLSLESFASLNPPFQLIGPTVDAARLVDRIAESHPNFRLTVDLSHLAQLGEDPVESVKHLGARIRHVHMSTCIVIPGHPLFGDLHPSFRTAGVAVTFDDACRALAAVAASSPNEELTVSVEVRAQGGEDLSQVFEDSRSDLLRAVERAAQR